MNKLFPGYKYIGIQEGVCGSRPTLIGHRLEPRHFGKLTVEQIKDCWNYLTTEQIVEALRFLEEHPEHNH
jgi:uncharacterized protein (DUF433 family)